MEDNKKQNRAMSQFMLIDALSGIYHTLHIIDLARDIIVEYNEDEYVSQNITAIDPQGKLNESMKLVCINEHLDNALDFVNLNTLAERLNGKKTITSEFISAYKGWIRARFITVDSDADGVPTRVIYATEIIDEEKRREEKLIKISLTDELTTLLNRRAYEEEIAEYKEKGIPDDLVYVSLDLNGLKGVNDNLGHSAGDEYIVGAAKIIRAALGTSGKVFRTGGDEFMAIIKADDETVKQLFDYMDSEVKAFKPTFNYEPSISKGWASHNEFPDASIEELAHTADMRMYDDKSRYYRETGKDRRR